MRTSVEAKELTLFALYLAVRFPRIFAYATIDTYMSAERIIEPSIKQQFNKIEDRVVVNAIAARMARVQKDGEQIYTHETYIAEDSVMQTITEACAHAYEPGLSHDEVWQRAQAIAVQTTLCMAANLAASASKEGYKDAQDIAVETTRAAFAMRAIDQIMPTYGRCAEPYPFKSLWDDNSPSAQYLDEIRLLAQESLRSNGIVVRDEETGDIIPVADIITEQEVTVENINYSGLLEQIRELGTVSDPMVFSRKIQELSRPMLRLRTSEHITDEQLDSYLQTVQKSSRTGRFSTAAAILGLPRDYIATVWAKGEQGAETINNFIAEAATDTTESGGVRRPRQAFVTALRDYFPGGLSGDTARANKDMQTIRTAYENGHRFHTDTHPNLGKVYSPKQITEYNRMSTDMVGDVCREIFPDDLEFGAMFAENALRSLSPRAYKEDQTHFYSADLTKFTNAFCSHIDFFGVEAIKKLSESFDVGALDVMHRTQLSTLIQLTSGDNATVKRLRKQDTSLILFDAYGDYNQFVTGVLSQLATSNPAIGQVVVPLRREDDIQKSLALLKQHNVKFCTLMFVSHGSRGGSFINKGSERLCLLADPLKRTTGHDIYPIQENHYVPVRDLSLKRIVRDDMCLPRFASETSMPEQKRIIHVACYSDVGTKTRKSVAETSLSIVGKHAVVMGVPHVATVRARDRNGSGLYIYGPSRGAEEDKVNVGHNINVVALKGRSSAEWIRVNGKLKKRRVITPKRAQFDGRIVV